MDEISAGHTNHIDDRGSRDHGLHDLAAAHFAAGASNWNGIRANLAEMERKLGELQQRVQPDAPVSPVPALPIRQQLAPDTPAAQAQAAQVKQQIDELLRVRERLRESLRSIVGECERALGQLERGEVSAAGADVRAPAPEVAETLIAPAAAPAGISLRPTVFQGSVSLRVGPLGDISQVDTLEIALLQLPGAERVEIKEFSGRDAVAELRLYQPVRLVEELHRVLPFSFQVTEGDAGSLTLLAAVEAVSG